MKTTKIDLPFVKALASWFQGYGELLSQTILTTDFVDLDKNHLSYSQSNEFYWKNYELV